MRTSCYCFIGAIGLLTMPAGFSFGQVSTNEGGYETDQELRHLNERIQVLEARQSERIERERAFLRSQLHEARRLERSRGTQSQGAMNGDRPSKKATERTANDQSWRYRYYQGRWWYWRPSNSWAVYDQDRWVPYQARAPARYFR